MDLFYANRDHDYFKSSIFFKRKSLSIRKLIFYLRHIKKFKDSLLKLEAITKEKWFHMDDNVDGLAFLYIYNNKFNLHFMEGSFKEGLPLIDAVLERLKSYKDRIDEHHIMVFYYKIASMYFGAGENKKCIQFLEKIISNKSLQMREDLLCFSRILNLSCPLRSRIRLQFGYFN